MKKRDLYDLDDSLKERFPQVCENCESRVQAAIHQAGYVAKADHLRRMMERSRAARAARKARNWNWRSLLVFAGAVGYWGSVAGQLSWNLMGAMKSQEAVSDQREPPLLSCIRQAIETQRVETHCSSDLVPYAGLALVLGIISLWWNPKLRLKVEGRNGRFAGLGEYYKLQMILIVMRFAAWALLRDPAASSIPSSLLPVLHVVVAAFTIVVGSLPEEFLYFTITRLITHELLIYRESWLLDILSGTTPRHLCYGQTALKPALSETQKVLRKGQLAQDDSIRQTRTIKTALSVSHSRNLPLLDSLSPVNPPPYLPPLQKQRAWIGLHPSSKKFDLRTVECLKAVREASIVNHLHSTVLCLQCPDLQHGIFGTQPLNRPLNKSSSAIHSTALKLQTGNGAVPLKMKPKILLPPISRLQSFSHRQTLALQPS